MKERANVIQTKLNYAGSVFNEIGALKDSADKKKVNMQYIIWQLACFYSIEGNHQ